MRFEIAMALRRPIKIGKYEVVDLLGKGGMGVVYKANDPFLGRAVAIKMMTTVDYVDNPDLLQRFYREAQSTGNLHHRNIVTVYELGDQDGSPYLVMEYLEGESLDAIISSRRALNLLEKINFIAEVCDGLAYAHQRSVVHRDIKPGNIMVLKDSGVKIVDFGIAHIGNRTVTRTGQLLGSLPYMSPEQISGKQVDARTDIFSLGVVLYQLLTFNLPFEGETPAATLLKIIHEKPRPLSDFLDSFPHELDDIVQRALAKSREERYATVQDLAFDLVQVRERIQQELLEEHLHEAESLLASEELLKAKDQLQRVLKIDRHNTRAVELLRTAQQRIQQQELGEQVRQLRGQAEEAYQKEQFGLALDLIQRALSLHSTDPDLQRFRSNVQQAKSRADELHRAMERAESAYQQGELDSAKQAIEEALALAPEDVHTKSLYRAIQRDWTQREQRRQLHNLIEEARKEIASRHFTLALEVLRKAEEIDPGTPHLQALINAARSAREQEHRRKELDNAKREIEADLDRDDFQAACTKAEAALEQFPDDRGLQKLKDLADKQRALAERKYFIDEQVAQARRLLEAGRTEEVLELLQAAQQKVGGDPHLESLLVIVRETLERQRAEAHKAEYLRRAKDLLRRKEYAGAIETLEAAQAELGRSAEIDDLLQFTIEQSDADRRRLIADAAAEKAQALVKDQDYDKAVDVLETALREAPDEELRIILMQARQGAADYQKLLQDAIANAQSMMQGQRPTEALKYLESQPASFARDSRFVELSQKAREQSARLKNIEQALEKARVFFGRDEFEPARAILDECVRTHGRTPDLNKLIAEIEERELQVAADTLESALSEARGLIKSGEPRAAMDRLGQAGAVVARVPRKLAAVYEALLQEAANAQARKFKSETEHLLARGEHSDASAVLQRALAEFPQHRDLQLLRKSLDQAAQRRREAQKLLTRAQELFGQGAWREGGDTCLRAGPLASRDPVVLKEILDALQAAAHAAVGADWRQAEFLLQCMSQLEPGALPAAVQEKVENARRDELVNECLAEAKRMQSRGNLQEAIAEINRSLASYPQDARLAESKSTLEQLLREREEQAQREKERQKKAAYVSEVYSRLKRENDAEGRIKILEDALRTYPDETAFRQELEDLRGRLQKANALAEEARTFEQSRNYDRAIQSWHAIRALGIPYPALDSSLGRLRRLQDEARASAKAAWLKGIHDALTSFNYDTATALLADAQREFPGDKDLGEAGRTRDQAIKQRQEALELITESEKAFRGQHWQQGSESLERCSQRAGRDPAVRPRLFSTFVQGSQAALAVDLGVSEALLQRAAEIQPDASEVANLRTAVEEHKRDAAVMQQIARVNVIAEGGDLERALGEINRLLSKNPTDSRIQARKQELERDLQFELEAREKREHLIELLEAAQNLREQGDFPGTLQKIEEGLAAFPGHSQFEEMKRSVESAIREAEERRRREEERQKKEEQERAARERRRQEEQQRLERAARQKAGEEAERQRQQKARQEEEARRKAEQRKAAEDADRRRKAKEEEDRQRIAAERKSKVTELRPQGGQQQSSSKEHVTEIHPISIPKPRTPSAPAASRDSAAAQLAVSAAPRKAADLRVASEGRKPLKLYAAVAACIIVAAVLTAVLWKGRKAGSPGSIAVQITTMPEGASVRVRGTDQECVTPKCAVSLAPGTYEVQIDMPGYRSVIQPLTVSPGNPNSLALSLNPESPAQQPSLPATKEQLARLTMRGAEPGAEVLVDKQSKGKVSRRGTFSTEVPAGEHEIQLMAKNVASGGVVRNFPSGGRIELNRGDFPAREAVAPPAPPPANARPNPEESSWQQVKDSRNIEDVEKFLKQYPSGVYRDQAQNQLESLYWAKATGSDSVAGYKEYLNRYAGGRYSQQAEENLAKLDWRAVENSSDPAALESFLKRHPSASYRDRALSKLDDLAWGRTSQNDISSLRLYVQNFPTGRHIDEARRKIEELNRPPQVARSTAPRITESSPLDDKKAVLDVLVRYQKAYEGQDIQGLRRIWPGMTSQQIKGVGEFFKHASSLTLNYSLIEEPEINGDRATVKFTQSLSYVAGGKPGRDSAKVVMQLSKLPGTPGNWQINSIR